MERCLEPVDIRDPAGVENWHERYELYVLTNDKISTANKTAFYLTLIGKQAYDLLKDLAFPDDISTKTVDKLKKLLLNHLRPVHFEATERARFHNLPPGTGEPQRVPSTTTTSSCQVQFRD